MCVFALGGGGNLVGWLVWGFLGWVGGFFLRKECVLTDLQDTYHTNLIGGSTLSFSSSYQCIKLVF